MSTSFCADSRFFEWFSKFKMRKSQFHKDHKLWSTISHVSKFVTLWSSPFHNTTQFSRLFYNSDIHYNYKHHELPLKTVTNIKSLTILQPLQMYWCSILLNFSWSFTLEWHQTAREKSRRYEKNPSHWK